MRLQRPRVGVASRTLIRVEASEAV